MNPTASRLHCSHCARETIFTRRGCCHCGNAHASQVERVDERWMAEFLVRSERAREKARLRMQKRRLTDSERKARYVAKKKHEMAVSAAGVGAL